MPLSVQRSVRKQNIKFLHNRIHFSPEYFHFMKRLVQSNVQVIVTFFQQQHGEKIVSTNVIKFFHFYQINFIFIWNRRLKILKNQLQLVFKQPQNFFFLLDGAQKKLYGLFNRSIFSLKCADFSSGPAMDWTELIIHCIRWSRKARYYLAEEVLFKHPNRFQEYLIDCTSAEVNRFSFFSIYFS